MTPVETTEVTNAVSLKNGWGGTRPLPCTAMWRGPELCYSSAWVPTEAELDLLRTGNAAISLVACANPKLKQPLSFSMKVVEFGIVAEH